MKKIKNILSKLMEFMLNIWYRIFGNRDYKKFVIITSARTGSNLLVRNLNSHKNIETKGEVFRKLSGRTSSKRWNEIFNFKNKYIHSAGFKIFYHHPDDQSDAKVWEMMKDDKSLKIIHLVRENKIRSYVSFQIAEKTGRWKMKKNTKIPLSEKQFKLDFENFIKRTNTIEMYEEKIRLDFQDHPFIEISYEDLVKDKNKIFQRLCSFLEVENQELKSPLKKQNKEQLKDLILNYDEFKKKIFKTKYSSFIK